MACGLQWAPVVNANPSIPLAVGALAPRAISLSRGLTRAHVRHADDDDLAQDVLLSLLSAARGGRFDLAAVDDADAYLRVALRRQAARIRRRAESRVEDGSGDLDATPSDGDDPEKEVSERQDRALRVAAIAERLGPRDRLALRLIVGGTAEPRALADALGISANNAYQIQFRIRRAVIDAPT